VASLEIRTGGRLGAQPPTRTLPVASLEIRNGGRLGAQPPTWTLPELDMAAPAKDSGFMEGTG